MEKLSDPLKVLVPLGLIVGSCSIVCVGCLAAVALGAIRINPQPPARNLDEFFVDVYAFPDNWIRSEAEPSSVCRAAPLGSGCRSWKSLGTTYNYTEFPYGGAAQSIYQYLDPEGASRDFERMKERNFSFNSQFGTPWSIPSELAFSSTSASRSRLGCHFHGSSEYCQLIAQYQEIIVLFSIRRSILHNGEQIELLTYEEFQDILQSMDELIASGLANS